MWKNGLWMALLAGRKECCRFCEKRVCRLDPLLLQGRGQRGQPLVRCRAGAPGPVCAQEAPGLGIPVASTRLSYCTLVNIASKNAESLVAIPHP